MADAPSDVESVLSNLDATNFFGGQPLGKGMIPGTGSSGLTTEQQKLVGAATEELRAVFDRTVALTNAARGFVRAAIHQTDVSEDDGGYLDPEGYDKFIGACEKMGEVAMLAAMARFLGMDKASVDIVMQERLRSFMLPSWYFKITNPTPVAAVVADDKKKAR